MEVHHDPVVVVWDLDGTIWQPEMYELRGGSPFRELEDGTVVDSRGERIRLLADGIHVLLRLKEDWPHVHVGIASTCDEPAWAKELLRTIKVRKQGGGDLVLGDLFREDLVEIYYARDK